MSNGTYAHRLGLMVSLVAPVGSLCECVALHVRDAVEALQAGGIAARDWLNIVCPHGMDEGCVFVTWRESPDRGVSARWRYGPDGEPRLSGIGLGDGRDTLDGLATGLGSTYAAVSMVGTFDAAYTIGDIMAWLLSCELGGAESLPGGIDIGRDLVPQPAGSRRDAPSPLAGCGMSPDLEGN